MLKTISDLSLPRMLGLRRRRAVFWTSEGRAHLYWIIVRGEKKEGEGERFTVPNEVKCNNGNISISEVYECVFRALCYERTWWMSLSNITFRGASDMNVSLSSSLLSNSRRVFKWEQHLSDLCEPHSWANDGYQREYPIHELPSERRRRSVSEYGQFILIVYSLSLSLSLWETPSSQSVQYRVGVGVVCVHHSVRVAHSSSTSHHHTPTSRISLLLSHIALLISQDGDYSSLQQEQQTLSKWSMSHLTQNVMHLYVDLYIPVAFSFHTFVTCISTDLLINKTVIEIGSELSLLIVLMQSVKHTYW